MFHRHALLLLMLTLPLAAAGEPLVQQDAASRPATRPATRPAGRVVATKGDVAEIVLPRGWREMEDLNEEADLQVGDLASEAYFVVLSEPKADFDPELGVEGHSDLTRESMLGALKNPEVSEPTRLKINGMDAVQYQIAGSTEGLRIIYFHTTIEGKEHFHQIVAWTLPSRLEANKPNFDAVLNSFRER
jgi:hypothetical protein